MNIDRKRFFDAFRAEFGSLDQKQVAAIETLLGLSENDPAMSDVRWIAYALATIKHETANTYAPIAEIGHGKGRPYGEKDPETHQVYYGRGYVQLTWRRNYERMGDLLDVDLVNQPDLAMEPETAYKVLSLGMRRGLFTGKKLGDYINGDSTDYLHARRIINAMDKAQLIADYAQTYEEILRNAQIVDDPVPEPDPAPIPAATTVEHHDFVQTIAANDTVKEIAKSGVTQIGARVSTGLASGGLLTAIDAFISQHYRVLIFSGGLIALAVIVVLFILWHKSQQQKLVAQIASDPTRTDVRL